METNRRFVVGQVLPSFEIAFKTRNKSMANKLMANFNVNMKFVPVLENSWKVKYLPGIEKSASKKSVVCTSQVLDEEESINRIMYYLLTGVGEFRPLDEDDQRELDEILRRQLGTHPNRSSMKSSSGGPETEMDLKSRTTLGTNDQSEVFSSDEFLLLENFYQNLKPDQKFELIEKVEFPRLESKQNRLLYQSKKFERVRRHTVNLATSYNRHVRDLNRRKKGKSHGTGISYPPEF